jgi:hypothetical protein
VEEQVNELQNNVKFVMDSVQQTLTAVQSQQESLQRALVILADNKERSGSDQLSELKTEVGVVKSLLLSRNQFAPLPREPPSLPPWQLSAGKPSVGQTSPSSAPVANGFHSASTTSLPNVTSQNGLAARREVNEFDEEDDGTRFKLPLKNGAKRKDELEGEEEEEDEEEREETEKLREEAGTPV